MGKLSYGPATKHIKQSHGGDTDPLKHYCTQYGTKYGQHFSKFEPRTGRHCGTGYQSNFRPGVYYSAKLDHIDNPAMGAIVADNYASVTQKSFRPYTTPSGKEPLPFTTHQTGSGFIRQKNVNIPTSGEVYGVAIDTRVASAPAGVLQRHRPYLHKIKGKDTKELENGGYGPRFMSTETHEKFQGKQRSGTGPNVCFKSDGSGFTHAYNEEPIIFHPDYAHRNDVPGWLTDRPTGFSIHSTDYRPLRVPRGDEPLPTLANRSEWDTGFTSGTRARPGFVHRVMSDAYDKASDIPAERLDRTKKTDPAEYINMTNPDNHSSVYKKTYRGQRQEPSEAERIGNVRVGTKENSSFSANHDRFVQTSDNPARFITHYQTSVYKKTYRGQRPEPSEDERIGNVGVGTKENSGFSANHDRFVQTSDNPARFITHYQTRFLDKTPFGTDRQGHVWGGVLPQKPDGYTRSIGLHTTGPDYDPSTTRRTMEPYVGRSTIARDPFFDEHHNDQKIHKPVSIACF